MELKSEVGFGFARVLGFEETDVTKAAKAQLEVVTTCGSMVPLGVEEKEFGAANLVQFTVKKGGGEGDAGYYGVLDLDELQGGGAKDYNQWLAYGYGGYLYNGTILPVEPGNMAGPTFNAFSRDITVALTLQNAFPASMRTVKINLKRIVRVLLYHRL